MTEPIEEIEARLAGPLDDAERVVALNRLSFLLYQNDPQRSLRLATEALALAEATGDRHGEGNSLSSLAICLDTLCDYPTAMAYARRSHEIFRELGDEGGMASAMNSIGISARGMADYAVALPAFREALEICTRRGEKMRMGATYNNIGTIHNAIGNFPEALEAYLSALRIYEEIGEEWTMAITIANVGVAHFYLGDYDTSFTYQQRAMTMARRLGHIYCEALAVGTLSSIYSKRGDTSAAFEAAERQLEIFQQLGDRAGEASARLNLGMLYESDNDPKKAFREYRSAAKLSREVGSSNKYVEAERCIGDLHRRRGEYERALAAFGKALAEAKKAGIRKAEADVRNGLALTCEAMGDFEEAYTHLRLCHTLRGDIYGEDRSRAIAEMQVRFDVERAERERELFRLKSEHLEQMMEQRSKELTSMAMHLVQKKMFLQKLRKDVTALSQQHQEGKGMLKDILHAISENVNGADDWQRFEQEFQHVHQGFVTMLSERCPRLTPTELKVCALLKITLSNKEIARLLSVSLRNVESHRYSIRKKLGLPSDANLSSHLAGLQGRQV